MGHVPFNRSSVRVLEDTEGLVFARASNGCLWLCKSGFSSASKESRSALETLHLKSHDTLSVPQHHLTSANEKAPNGNGRLPIGSCQMTSGITEKVL